MVTNGHKISYQNEINLSDRSFSLPWKPMKREQNFNLPTNALIKDAAWRCPATSVSASENLLAEVSCRRLCPSELDATENSIPNRSPAASLFTSLIVRPIPLSQTDRQTLQLE